MYKSFKYRLYPDEEQKILLEKHFGCTRFVYNYFLGLKQKQYNESGTSGTYNQLAKELVNLKYSENYDWLKEINSQTLQQSLKDLFTAYDKFFTKKSKYPKFTKKGIKLRYHRQHQGTIKSMTISKTASGNYYVSVLCLIPDSLSISTLSKTKKSIGIDLGIKDYIVCSDNFSYSSFPKNEIEKLRRKLKRYQRHFSRK